MNETSPVFVTTVPPASSIMQQSYVLKNIISSSHAVITAFSTCMQSDMMIFPFSPFP